MPQHSPRDPVSNVRHLTGREIRRVVDLLPMDSPYRSVANYLLGQPDTLAPASDVLAEGVSLRFESGWRERMLAVEAMRVTGPTGEEAQTAGAALAATVVAESTNPRRRVASRVSHAGSLTFVAAVVAVMVFSVTGLVFGLMSALDDRLPLLLLWKVAIVCLNVLCALAAGVVAFAFPASLIVDARRYARWRNMAACALARCGGPSALSGLARMAAEAPNVRSGPAWDCFQYVLPSVTGRHYGRLPSNVGPDLCRVLEAAAGSPTDEALARDILNALAAAGGGSALPPLRRFIARIDKSSETGRQAARVLTLLEERDRTERNAASLLRSASSATGLSSLVRPAARADTDSSRLPRLVVKPQSETYQTSEPGAEQPLVQP